jgi:serine/threonine-protein kinase RsbW
VEIKMVLFLPRDAASVPLTRQCLDSCLQTLGVLPDTRSDIALALGEACANVILHAGPADDYRVTARAKDGRCLIDVVNRGNLGGIAAPGHNPTSITAEHGRGLKIMDAVVDNLQLTDGRDQTSVHFEKALAWVPGAPGEQLLSPEA